MKLSDTDFNQKTRETLSRVIEKDENILWCGSPEGKAPIVRSIPVILFAIIWMAIPSFMIWTQIQVDGPDKPGVEMIFPMVFILIGLALPAGVYRFHKRQRQAAYALTEKRAILLAPKMISGTKAFTYPVKEDMLLEVTKKKNGSGNLVFDYSDIVVNGKPLPRGFLNVKDVETPLSLLKEMGVKTGQESFDF